MRTSRKKRQLVALGLVAAAVAAGAAYAAIPDAAGVIHGCVNKAGALRVIDPAAGDRCSKTETDLPWSQRGPKGDAGPAGQAGAAGPAGPPGTVAQLDDLEGVRCRGINGKIATVHLEYGTGIEAPVTIICITHLVANPGPLTVRFTSGTLALPLLTFPLPSGDAHFSGVIDTGGRVTVPGSGFQLPDIPFDTTEDSNGFVGLHVFGHASFSSTGVSGFLDPEPGTASLTAGAYASVTLTATAQILDQQVSLYSGTCSLGTAASPLGLTLTTAAPGVPYSQSTGAVTLSAAFDAPSLDGCSPAMPSAYAFLLTLLAGHDRLTLSGTTEPIIKAP
jgi:hypothetical protein